MNQTVLRNQLKEEIGDKKVIAASFHTFNFDPLFFENYVMPLLVTGKDFSNEAIFNRIQWRYCAREGLIPPISVYCDYYAKDDTQAPGLGYEIFCLKVPVAHGAISNFHPKNIFLLLEDKNEQPSLLLFTSSANITPAGWCENLESLSLVHIPMSRNYPNRTTTNVLQRHLRATADLAGLQLLPAADEMIYEFLRKTDLDNAFYSSFESSLIDFLNKNIFEKDHIGEIEIISPYFSNSDVIIRLLQSKGIRSIKSLIPMARSNEVLLEKETFLNLQQAGITWCKPKTIPKGNPFLDAGHTHAKIYKFYGEKENYLFIGSPNFTLPAWTGYESLLNRSNIETGILYDKLESDKLLGPIANIDVDNLHFFQKDELENPDSKSWEDRNAPDINFTINWETSTLIIKAFALAATCYFNNILDNAQIPEGHTELELPETACKQLTRNALLKVLTRSGNHSAIYCYYPNQLHIQRKPLGYDIGANTTLKYWQFLENEPATISLTSALADKMTDTSGIIDEEAIKTGLLLNEMAAHFNGLSNIEKHLFPQTHRTREQKRTSFKNLQYYLLTENIDTIPYYLNDLKAQFAKQEIQKSFYWMALQIINTVIYNQAVNWELPPGMDAEEGKRFKNEIKRRQSLIADISQPLQLLIPGLQEKVKWVHEQLNSNY